MANNENGWLIEEKNKESNRRKHIMKIINECVMYVIIIWRN